MNDYRYENINRCCVQYEKNLQIMLPLCLDLTQQNQVRMWPFHWFCELLKIWVQHKSQKMQIEKLVERKQLIWTNSEISISVR